MMMTCPKCSRANPQEAVYCYFDGFVLGGAAAGTGPLAINSLRFPSPFVFMSGRSCLNFDDLAIACHEESKPAADMLKQGFLESFLASIGRIDLSMAAKEAAKFPDSSRGLDELLGKFPSSVLSEARLNLSSQEINLGVLSRTAKREIKITIENGGMRLLFGSITSDSTWLAIGETGNASVKNFQTTGELTVPLRIVPEKLRASDKPLVAKLKIDSSGGSSVVLIRAEVPVTPFQLMPLSGALNPRQIASKAKANAKESAILFENGSVAKWYESNGWSYPVQGPSATGMGAIQQFFEALGLTPPPKTFINQTVINLEGAPGQELVFELTVGTEDKRPVFAHGFADQSWITAKNPKLTGSSAVLGFVIPQIPDRPGELLVSKIAVTSNGNQKFLVQVNVQVSGKYVAPKVEPSPELVFTKQPVFVPGAPPPTDIPEAEDTIKVDSTLRKKAKGPNSSIPLIHFVPFAGLVSLMVILLIADAGVGVGGKTEGGAAVAKNESAQSSFGYSFDIDKKSELKLDFSHKPKSRNYRFGLFAADKKDPKDESKNLRLTYDQEGDSNNTRVRIDDSDFLFAQLKSTSITEDKEDFEKRVWRVSCDYRLKGERIKVSQFVQIVPGSQSGNLDTCIIRYTVENKGKNSHKIGLRMMLDTFIGSEDGVPFVVPGMDGFVTKFTEFTQKDMPDFIEAMQFQNLDTPGVIAHLGLKGFQLPDCEPEPLYKLYLGENPGSKEFGYDADASDLAIKKGKDGSRFTDSVAFLYWNERDTNPGEVREFVFSYGLGEISKPDGSSGGKLSVTTGGNTNAGKTFTLTALVKDATKGQAVIIALPEGVNLASGETKEKTIVEVDRSTQMSQVSWKVSASKAGVYSLKVASGQFSSQTKVQVREASSSLFR
ncbi:MAG: hypothetical protein NTV50_11470 [Planctomycetota bacterium]|nr:hypothetical protein [Planctomycetota bacterium]